MKRLFLGLVLAATASLLIPLSANAAEYETFVGCDDLAENPIPAHECQIADFPGAFFESDVNTEYEVCVEFPNTEVICSEEEAAEAGVLYVNSIGSEEEGNHLVSWYVEGTKIGSWTFRLSSPPPPPPPPAPTPVQAAVTLPSVTPSTDCQKAQRRVGKLKSQLHNANGAPQRAKIRAKLRTARAAARRVC